MATMVSTTVPTDYTAEAAAIERKRQLAQLLQQQSMQPLDTNQQAGGMTVPISWTQGLAKMLQAYSGAKGQSNADTQTKELATKYQTDLADTLRRASDAATGTPAQAPLTPNDDNGNPMPGVAAQAPDMNKFASILAGHPATQATGTSMMLQNAQRQAIISALTGGQGQQGMPAPNGSPQTAPTQSIGGPAGGLPMSAYMPPGTDPNIGYQAYLKALQADRPKFGEISPKDYTAESLLAFSQSHNPADLVPLHKKEAVPLGGHTEFVDPYNPPVAPLEHTASPDTLLTNNTRVQQGDLNRGVTLRGQDLTDTRDRQIAGIGADGLPTGDIKDVAQMIAAGQIPPLTSLAMSRPRGQQIMAEVLKVNPNYDYKTVNAQKVAEQKFTTGPEAQKIRSFNVALSHLDTLGNLSDALHNGNLPLINKVGNIYSQQTGAPAPTNFSAAKQIVGDEIVKAIVGSGGGVADREKAQATVNAASSPAQLKGVIATYKELMRGQLGGLRQQYQTATGKSDFDRFLTPQAQSEVKGASHPDYPGFSIAK